MLDHEPDTTDTAPTAQSAIESTPESSEGPASSAAAPRRRRAATRKAGPPSVAAESSEAPAAETPSPEAAAPTPVMAAEAAPSGDVPEAAVDQQPPPAKKATRKRATKSAEPGARAPRKRTTKKAAAKAAPAAAAPAEDGVPAEAAPAEDSVPAAAAPTAAAPTEDSVPAAAAPAAAAPAADGVPAATAIDLDEGAAPGDTESASHTASAALDEIRLALAEEREDAAAEGVAADETAAEEAEQSVDATEPADQNDLDGTGDGEDDSDEGEEADTSAEGDTDESGAPRRRRRRRGGRRRRRGGGSDTDDAQRDGTGDRQEPAGPVARSGAPEVDVQQPGGEPSSAGADDKEPEGDRRAASASGARADEAQDTGDDGSGEEGGQRRRRRRRRRRGEDSGPSADDPAEVVVRVREPRSRQKAAQEVTGIEGSTRMEAKRQRRREGREAGRRRAPILSEAEFLARRESVVRKMIIRQREELSQIAVLEDDILVEHYVDRESAASLIGNVYLGRVQNVLPSMEAAFIDIGRGRNAVLYAGEVDWDAFGANGQQRKVENVLKSGQTVLVQVTKDPVGAKGARLTSHITLPGRYIVYAPGGHLSGISRKLPDNERKRLKSVLNDLVPESASVIVRTAAEGASEDELVRDVNRLKAQWEDIERKVKAGSAPKLLYGEPDLTVRIVRDLFTEDFAELIIQGNGSASDAYDAVDAYVEHVAPHLHDRLRRWDAAEGDLFASYRLDEQIAKALERKVFLPSGGSLIIDRTEAMTVIDVNTGKFTGSGGNLEATVTSNNLEAAEEIVRQLRLRDVGGIIVIDFIDMVLPSNRELLLRRLVECLGRDRTRHQVAEVTSLGLVQMTRKKIGTGLLEAFTTECEQCHGRGYEISDVPVETQKQPDGGSRDPRGGGRDRGRGRGGQSGSGPNGSNRPAHPVPAPPLHRPVPAPPLSAPGDAAEPEAESVAQLADSAPGPAPVPDQAAEPVAEATATTDPASSDQPTREPASAS